MNSSEFAINIAEKKPYQTYILLDSSQNAIVEVIPERGGIISRWRVADQEILYMDRERLLNPDLSIRGGIPILFPICGNLPDNTYVHHGTKRTLKQHGFARDLPWKVIDQNTQNRAGLTLLLESDDDTREMYPFDFRLTFSYQIKGNALEILQRYENLSPEPMPFSTGLHPYFLVSDKSQLRFEIPGVQYRDQRTQEIGDFTGRFDSNLDEIDVTFDNLTGLAATGIDSQRGLRLTVCYHSSYSSIVFWTLKGKDFYCLEPWTAPRNALNTGFRLTSLPPGGTFDTWVRMTANFFAN